MDGRNSIGRKVSLLNDECAAAGGLSIGQLPTLSTLRLHSYTASQQNSSLKHQQPRSPSSDSVSSTPSLSPQTPQLVRSESSSSRGLPPSPLTPHFHPFDSLYHHQKLLPPHRPHLARLPSYTNSKMDDHTQSLYPPIPDASGVMPYPMPPPTANLNLSSTTTNQPTLYRASTSPQSESSRVQNASSSANKAVPKKNQYPCPLAKAFNCSDFFTTSGHAARHAKKHTGKKDAFCPECNKAFTRKDNMEQHRRTHQNVRGPAKSSATDSKVKKPTKPQSRKSDKPLSAPLEAAALAHVEEQQQQQQQQQQQEQQQQHDQQQQQLHLSLQQQQAQQHMVQQSMMSQGPYFINPDPVQALPQPVSTDFPTRPTLYRSGFTNPLDYIPPQAPMMPDQHDMHSYNYPSPGLSNGLDTLALAASDHHRRMSQEDSS